MTEGWNTVGEDADPPTFAEDWNTVGEDADPRTFAEDWNTVGEDADPPGHSRGIEGGSAARAVRLYNPPYRRVLQKTCCLRSFSFVFETAKDLVSTKLQFCF